MRKVRIYIDSYNSLNAFVYDNEHSDINPLHLKDEGAFDYVKLLDKFYPIDIIEDNNEIDVVFKYENFDIEISNYPNILANGKYKEAIVPICKKAVTCLSKKRMNSNINNKVARKNKYSGKKIIISALISVMLGSSLYSLDKNNKLSNTEVLDITSIINSSNTIEDITENVVDDSSKAKEEIKSVPLTNSYVNEYEDSSTNNAFLNYKDRSRSNKIMNTDLSYGDIIAKYSKIYGIDANLMLAIATQERGEHSEVMDAGGAIGLMQIQYDIWSNAKLRAYNFQNHSWEEIVVDGNKLSDLEYNIKIGCMIFQSYLKQMDYNICAAIQAYNMGCGTVERLVRQYASESNQSINQVLSSQTDIGWIDFRDIILYGDPEYLEHILSYCGNDINIIVLDSSNNQHNLMVSSISNEKQRV